MVAAAQNFWNLNIDGAVGLIISLVVLKAGFEVLGDALSPLIGGPEDKKLVDDITAYANSFPDVRGTYDVVLDNFGPNEILGSVHIEVPDDMCARDIHALTRQISEGLAEKFGILATVGIYAANTSTIYFDLVIGFKADDDAIRDKIIAHLKEKYPDYTYNVVIDHDYEDDQPT